MQGFLRQKSSRKDVPTYCKSIISNREIIMEKTVEELRLQMEGVISEFNKMDAMGRYKGILFKLGDVDAFICRNRIWGDKRDHNFIFPLNRGDTFVKEGESRYGVNVHKELVKPFISSNMKLFPVYHPDSTILLRPIHTRWDNKEMKTKKDRVWMSQFLCQMLGYS